MLAVCSGALMARVIPTPTLTTPYLVYWLPLDEAARRFDVSREGLTAAVRRGDLEVRAKVVGGDVVASVSSTDLAVRYGPPRSEPLPKGAAGPQAAIGSRDDLDGAHGRLVAAEDRARVLELDRARLDGRLETAERLERALQRYADRLEERREREREAYEVKLAEAEVVRLQLARVVGRLEADVAQLRGSVAVAPRRELPAPVASAAPGARPLRTGRWRRWLGRR